MPGADRSDWLEAFFRRLRHSGWRSLGRWRRRDSALLVGVLGLLAYLLCIVCISGGLGVLADVGAALLVVLLVALALAEAAFAVRPTQQRLAMADRLVVASVALFFALGIIGAIATAVVG